MKTRSSRNATNTTTAINSKLSLIDIELSFVLGFHPHRNVPTHTQSLVDAAADGTKLSLVSMIKRIIGLLGDRSAEDSPPRLAASGTNDGGERRFRLDPVAIRLAVENGLIGHLVTSAWRSAPEPETITGSGKVLAGHGDLWSARSRYCNAGLIRLLKAGWAVTRPTSVWLVANQVFGHWRGSFGAEDV
ncbi:hypothetical protein [Accumulibacter sp.]|uniref:hypothetical protein n=1 Tax=Accumulibacter sp. TaxID=2053492 RepID=UPI0028C41988|nr:hypothetical protein [Accumulibacter sp.]